MFRSPADQFEQYIIASSCLDRVIKNPFIVVSESKQSEALSSSYSIYLLLFLTMFILQEVSFFCVCVSLSRTLSLHNQHETQTFDSLTPERNSNVTPLPMKNNDTPYIKLSFFPRGFSRWRSKMYSLWHSRRCNNNSLALRTTKSCPLFT